MRCVLSKGKQREMLLLTKETLGLSWRELAKKLGISYTTIREWRDEKWSMRLVVFNKIIEVCPEHNEYKNYIVELKEDRWGQKVGGRTTKQRKHGFFDQAYSQQSGSWKSKGGQTGVRKWHVRMKNEHPEEYRRIQYGRIKQSLKYKCEFNGQKYRNNLELEVARILTEQKVEFEYERPLNCENRFYFPDFSLGEIVVECTFWHDVRQKAKELSQKIEDYHKLNLKIVIVTTNRYFEKYSELLSNLNVRVITSDKLTEVLDGKFGRVREPFGSSSKLSTDRAPAS